MLSGKKLTQSSASYYLTPTPEAYYLAQGEEAGAWIGRGADRLGAYGQVKPDEFQRILAGLSVDGTRALTEQAGTIHHQVGHDFTWSAPKSISVLFSTGDRELRRSIILAHTEAIKHGLAYLEDTAAFTRRGHGGRTREAVGLTAALFLHTLSRAGDPQIHSHCVIANVCRRADGSTGTIESRDLYRHKRTANSIYEAELGAQLIARLGVKLTWKGGSLEIEGVPETLCRALSTRRQEIEALLKQTGQVGAKASAAAALQTRPKKVDWDPEILRTRWESTSQVHGFGPNERANVLSRSREPSRTPSDDEIRDRIVQTLTECDSTFTEQDVVRAVARETGIYGHGAVAIRGIAHEFLASPEAIKLGIVGGTQRFTTHTMLRAEADVLACAQRLHSRTGASIRPKTISSTLSKHPHLSVEQIAAVHHLTNSSGRIRILSGLAGTGKTAAMLAVRDCYARDGYEVLGATLSAKAALELEHSAGIASHTIHRTLLEFDRPAPLRRTPFMLSPKTLMIVDEAGMVSTSHMSRILRAVDDAKATVILVGDRKQLQSIEAGGSLGALASRIGEATLSNIVRQKDEWARSAVTSLAHGHAATSLAAYAAHGNVSVCSTRAEAIKALITTWHDDSCRGATGLVIASTNQEIDLLNAMAQLARLRAGELGSEPVVLGYTQFYVGDRVLLKRNDRVRDLQNGTFGTIVRTDCTAGTITVRLDDGRVRTISTAAYPHIQLGYAATTHAAQGTTVEHAWILVGGPMQDLHLSYVQASRARTRTRMFTDVATAGQGLAHLSHQMSTSHEKEFALDILVRHKREHALSQGRR